MANDYISENPQLRWIYEHLETRNSDGEYYYTTEEIEDIFLQLVTDFTDRNTRENGIFYITATNVRAKIIQLQNAGEPVSGKLVCGRRKLAPNGAIIGSVTSSISLSNIQNEEVPDLSHRLGKMNKRLLISVNATRSQRAAIIRNILDGTEAAAFRIVISKKNFIDIDCKTLSEIPKPITSR